MSVDATYRFDAVRLWKAAGLLGDAVRVFTPVAPSGAAWWAGSEGAGPSACRQRHGVGSSDPDGTITRYDWTWGDGATSDGLTSSHTYATGGTYTVRLTVTDDDGATKATSRAVTVTKPSPTAPPATPNQPPIAAFTLTAETATVHVDARNSSDPDGSITRYEWRWGDDTPHGNGEAAIHTYERPGDHTIQLAVTDNHGTTSIRTQLVRIPQAEPVNESSEGSNAQNEPSETSANEPEASAAEPQPPPPTSPPAAESTARSAENSVSNETVRVEQPLSGPVPAILPQLDAARAEDSAPAAGVAALLHDQTSAGKEPRNARAVPFITTVPLVAALAASAIMQRAWRGRP